MLIYLVIIMSMKGQDFERRLPQDSLELCWRNAESTMDQLQTEHGTEFDTIGVGCVIDKEGKGI